MSVFNRNIGIHTLFVIIGMTSCGPQEPVNETPWVPFDDIFINLILPEYSNLAFDGGSVLIDGGVRGIILYRESSTLYHAYERNCTYLPNEACATVNVDISELFLIDPCCNSTFELITGYPTGGPAYFPLQKYRVLLDGSLLTITDEVIIN